jgi:glycosidase
MHWNGERNAGFSAGEPWLPVDPSYAMRNVEQQDKDPGSLLDWYRRLIWIRKEKPALMAGSYRVIDGVPKGVFAYLRESEVDRIAVFLNFTARRISIKGSAGGLGGGSWRVLLSSTGGRNAAGEVGTITLEPNEALIVEKT